MAVRGNLLRERAGGTEPRSDETKKKVVVTKTKNGNKLGGLGTQKREMVNFIGSGACLAGGTVLHVTGPTGPGPSRVLLPMTLFILAGYPGYALKPSCRCTL